MTLKRYSLWATERGDCLEHEHSEGEWCRAEDVQEHVKAQRADAQREALEYIRGWTVHELVLLHTPNWIAAIEQMQMHIDAALEQLAAGERMESVSQVDRGGE